MRSKLLRSRSSFITSIALISILALSTAAAFTYAQQGPAPGQAAPGAPPARGGRGGPPQPLPPATEPRPPQNDNYANRHKGFVEIAQKGDIGMLWVGDSITDLWKNRAQDIWD